MDAIDGELRRALAIDPSPEFLARVRTRIAEAPAPAGRRIPWIVVAPLLAAAALLVMITIVRRQEAHGPHTADVLIARIAVTPVGLLARAYRADVDYEISPAIVRVEPTSLRDRDARRNEPEVLIAADEAEALRRLILGVREGRIHLSPSLATEPFTGDIAIERITISPIPPLAGDEGTRP